MEGNHTVTGELESQYVKKLSPDACAKDDDEGPTGPDIRQIPRRGLGYFDTVGVGPGTAGF